MFSYSKASAMLCMVKALHMSRVYPVSIIYNFYQSHINIQLYLNEICTWESGNNIFQSAPYGGAYDQTPLQNFAETCRCWVYCFVSIMQ